MSARPDRTPIVLAVGAFAAAIGAVAIGAASPWALPLGVIAALLAATVIVLRLTGGVPRPPPTPVYLVSAPVLPGGALGETYGRGELYDTLVRLQVEMRVRAISDVPDEEEDELAEASPEAFRAWMEQSLDELERVS